MSDPLYTHFLIFFSVNSFKSRWVLEHFQNRCSIDSSLVLQKEQLGLYIENTR